MPPPGEFVYVPPGVPHCFQNVGDAEARILVLFSPQGGVILRSVSRNIPGRSTPASSAPALGSNVGMEVVGPPLAVSDPL